MTPRDKAVSPSRSHIAADRATWHFNVSLAAGDARSLAEAAYARAVGPYGIVERCVDVDMPTALPKLFGVIACGPKRTWDGHPLFIPIQGAAVAESHDAARLRAIGEALERYSFRTLPDPSDLLRATSAELGAACVPPERFALPLAGGADGRVRRDQDWVWAYSLTRECPVRIPAPIGYPSYGRRKPNNYLAEVSSTGIATHVAIEAALLTGLYEVIERDALMVTWLLRRSPQRIRAEWGDASLTQLWEQVNEQSSARVSLMDISCDDTFMTAACVMTSDLPSLPAVALGCATNLEPSLAVHHAILEAAQVVWELARRGWTRDGLSAVTIGASFADRARYYASGGGATAIEHLLASRDAVALRETESTSRDASATLARCVARLAEQDLEVLAVDLTPPDLSLLGIRTVRVLVPGMLDAAIRLHDVRRFRRRVRSIAKAQHWRDLIIGGDAGPCPLL